jgi:hypothetical protein
MNEIRINETPYSIGFGYEVRIIDKENNCYATSINMKKVEDRMAEYVPSILNLEKNDLSRLMDQLWLLGIRPSNGSGDTNAFEAVKYHLEDMRKLITAAGMFDRYEGPMEERK